MFRDHISEKKINKAYSVLYWVSSKALKEILHIYTDEHTFISHYKSMMCPHVEYANSVWCPFKIGDIKQIEKIQKRATKFVIKMKN